MEPKDIVPVQLVDQTVPAATTPTRTSPVKNKVAARIKIGQAETHIYNGADKYILATILKELSFHSSRLHQDTLHFYCVLEN
ncbi:hypothetical protein [Candidatus Enterococcus ferrettii]|uniref:Uncharacterized protein n=1 Tax=Candidatus Enterococcus ferrettii TaxID=2815324 RepID=A0ABV0EIA9_9ENTE|nr:hypothetical protein [Enterococcus sp. 665A]MBO1341790.1 hypothetical protein [Enterococcus sp. 665A]